MSKLPLYSKTIYLNPSSILKVTVFDDNSVEVEVQGIARTGKSGQEVLEEIRAAWRAFDVDAF